MLDCVSSGTVGVLLIVSALSFSVCEFETTRKTDKMIPPSDSVVALALDDFEATTSHDTIDVEEVEDEEVEVACVFFVIFSVSSFASITV